MNLLRYRIVGRGALLSALLAAAWGCTPRPAPERAVIRYVELVRAGDCAEAFRHLSPRLQDALQAESRSRAEERHLLADPPAPIETLYCDAGHFERVELRRTHSAMVDGDLADVRLVEAQPAGHLVPGFWPTRTAYVDLPMRAVVSAGRWRVENPGTLQALERSQRRRSERADARQRMRRR